MARKIKEHLVEAGCVTLYHEDEVDKYSILAEIQKEPGMYHCQVWNGNGRVMAEQQYKKYVAELERRASPQTCGMGGNQAVCTTKACPRERNDAGFWKLHHLICPYRGR